VRNGTKKARVARPSQAPERPHAPHSSAPEPSDCGLGYRSAASQHTTPSTLWHAGETAADTLRPDLPGDWQGV